MNDGNVRVNGHTEGLNAMTAVVVYNRVTLEDDLQSILPFIDETKTHRHPPPVALASVLYSR